MRSPHSPAHRPRRPGVGRGDAKAGKHLRAIKQAVPKQRAEWMELVHGVNVLRMDEEQQKFVNSHYRQLVNRGLNLAEARDVVELANAEYYGAIAFHRHVSVTDLLAYRQEKMTLMSAPADGGGGAVGVTTVTTEVTTKMATTFFTFEKLNDGNFSFT